jgi:hypothetical protein
VADDSLLKKQLDQKWRTLDQFEASLRKLEAHKLQWKAKYAIKEGELEAAKVRPHFRSSLSQHPYNIQSRYAPITKLAHIIPFHSSRKLDD